MKLLLIVIALMLCGAYLVRRLNPYLLIARRFFNLFREAQRLNVERPSADMPRTANASRDKLIRCVVCGTWLPASRALALRASTAVFCSPACLENAAGKGHSREAASGNKR